MTKSNNQKGFTLVELSIVLVIIGLLIGGILVAQSMIGTTKLQSTVRQLGQFDAAVANFYTKFNQIPGDSNVMGTSTGTNDGWISQEAAATTTHTTTNLTGEMGKFWFDLSQSGLKTTGTATAYTDCSAVACASRANGTLLNTYIPQAPVGNGVGYIPVGGASGSNYYVINYFSTGAASAITADPTAALKGSEAVAIDAKIDDGVGTTGQVVGYTGTTLTATNPVASGVMGGATAYTVTGSTPNTGLGVRIGIQTGLLQ